MSYNFFAFFILILQIYWWGLLLSLLVEYCSFAVWVVFQQICNYHPQLQ